MEVRTRLIIEDAYHVRADSAIDVPAADEDS